MTPRLLAPPPRFVLADPPPVTFSVIVPVYQSAAVIGDALASLFSQTRIPDEVIVSDDGSTDDLGAALEPFQDRITVVSGPNAGPAAARNRALGVASGDFVASLDSDDEFLPGRIEALEHAARARPDLDLVATDVVFEANGRSTGTFNAQASFPENGQRSAALDRCFVAVPAMRRSRLLAIGGFDESLRTSEDWDVLIRLVLAGASAGLVDEPLYRYRLRPDSVTADRLGALRSRVDVLDGLRSHPGLSPREEQELERSRDVKFRRVLQAEAELAVTSGGSGVRRRALALARAPGSSARQRLVALAWAASPELGRRRLTTIRSADRASSSPWSRSTE